MRLKVKQKLPIDLDHAWSFFTDPRNLDTLTPGDMGFEITTDLEQERIYPGMIITYKVSPLLGIKMNWTTEITHVADRSFFVDDQRAGPFSLWHHQHHFRSVEGGVEMTDIVHYRAPLGFLGRLAEHWIVNRRVNQIFDYRRKVLEEIFGKWEERSGQ